tara:strand:- start:299 stop:439 length:141 start_codon:yes stop_codon:yes gene_type:complete
MAAKILTISFLGKHTPTRVQERVFVERSFAYGLNIQFTLSWLFAFN